MTKKEIKLIEKARKEERENLMQWFSSLKKLTKKEKTALEKLTTRQLGLFRYVLECQAISQMGR